MKEDFVKYLKAKWNSRLRVRYLDGDDTEKLSIAALFIAARPGAVMSEQLKRELVTAANDAKLRK